jgi:hypothetical protein
LLSYPGFGWQVLPLTQISPEGQQRLPQARENGQQAP